MGQRGHRTVATVGDHSKRVCILTGASGTLGTTFCRQFGKDFEIVAVHNQRELSVSTQNQWPINPLQPTANEVDVRVFAIRADLTKDAQLQRIVELTLARFSRIDLLVNAAAHIALAPMLHTDALLESFGTQFQLNVYVPLKLSALVANMFWRSNVDENRQLRRNIVNVSSTSSTEVYPGLGQGGYSASKAALDQLTRHMAVEFDAIGIRVNAIRPTSFPELVSTSEVANEICAMDRAKTTGEIRVVQ